MVRKDRTDHGAVLIGTVGVQQDERSVLSGDTGAHQRDRFPLQLRAHAEASPSGSMQRERFAMRTHLSHTQRMGLVFALLLAPATVLAAQTDSDSLVKGATIIAPTEKRNAVASGSVEDTLNACLGRIPLDASAGQRLLAEQSCAGQQETRHLLPSAPKF
jgi:hypothetical protein